MRIKNVSRKVIGIAQEALLPGEEKEISDEYANHPTILNYIKKGAITTDCVVAAPLVNVGLSDSEKEEIEKAAIAKYIEEQQAQKEQTTIEIEAVKGMNKSELLTKAVALGIEVNDSDTANVLKEKIINHLSK